MKTPIPLKDVPDSKLPPKVRQALAALLRAANEESPTLCVGAVITFVFENGTEFVAPILASSAQTGDGSNPYIRLVEVAAGAIADYYEKYCVEAPPRSESN